MKIVVILLTTIVLTGCLMTSGYYARSDECKRLGEHEKGKREGCMNRLYNKGFARDLDPAPAPAGTPRRLPSDLFKPLTDLYKQPAPANTGPRGCYWVCSKGEWIAIENGVCMMPLKPISLCPM
jgi:hypothetical protein